MTHSTKGDNGFDLAFFKPNIVVTSTGQIREIQVDDFAGLSRLAEEVSALPKGNRNFYSDRSLTVYHTVSCRPHIILNFFQIPESGEPLLDKTSVYGFSKDRRDLQSGGDLPDVLWELFGLVTEAQLFADIKKDDDVLKKVKEIFAQTFDSPSDRDLHNVYD
jgi:hypothetical protein